MKFLLVLGVLVAAPFAAWAIVAGERSKRAAGGLQMAAAAATVAFYALVTAVAAERGLDALRSRSSLATPAEDAGVWLVVAAGAALTVAVLVAALPLRLPRGALMLAVVGVMTAGVTSAGIAVAVTVGEDECDDFRFERAEWRAALRAPDPPGKTSKAERMADAIVRCGTVDGATRPEVQRSLGPPGGRGHRRWTWLVGTANDALGPGDGQELWVEFTRGGRVRNAELLYP